MIEPMATPSRAASSLRWVLTLLAVVLAGAGSLVGAGPASALTQLHTYDAATYSYDGALRLSTVHAPVEAGLGLPAGPRVAPGVSHVSIGWFGVAAEGGADVAGTTARLQAHVDQAVADYDSGAISMSARQARAAGRNPNLEQTYRGQVIDSAVKNAVRNDSDLSHLWVSRSGEFGPDFHDIGTGTWWDVTTPGQWLNHVDSYTDPFGAGIGLFTR